MLCVKGRDPYSMEHPLSCITISRTKTTLPPAFDSASHYREEQPACGCQSRLSHAGHFPAKLSSLCGRAEITKGCAVSLSTATLYLFYFIVYVHKCFVCMYACAPPVCLVSEGARRGHQIPLELGFQMVISWLLGIKPSSSGKVPVLLTI